MNLLRLLIIVGIVWISYRIYKNWKSKNEMISRQNKKNTGIKNMVQCVKCGVHLPEQEAIKASGKFFCCEEHKN